MIEVTEFDAKAFAKRVYRHEIFTSDMVRPHDKRLLSSIFMPIIFMTEEQRQDMIARDVTCLWAETSDALDRAVNGYPMFADFGVLTRAEHTAFVEEYNKLLEILGD